MHEPDAGQLAEYHIARATNGEQPMADCIAAGDQRRVGVLQADEMISL